MNLDATQSREEWKKLDFNGLKKQQLGKLEEKLATVKAMQREHRTNQTYAQLEQAEYLQTENAAL